EFGERGAVLSHGGTEAPAGLWERIAQTLEEEPPRLATPPPAEVVRLESRRARLGRRIAVAAAVAAAVLAVVVLSVKVVQQGDRIDDLERSAGSGAVPAAAEAASRDPNPVRTSFASTDPPTQPPPASLP